MAGKTLTIERVFDAPVEAVWRAWTEPESFKKWWGPKDFTCPATNMDFRVGGKYLHCMRGPAGTEFDKDFWSTGTYKEIIPLKKIVATDSFADENGNVVSASHYGMPGSFPMETTVSISFEEQGNPSTHSVNSGSSTSLRTRMTLFYQSTEGIEGKMLKDMTQGWNQSFDKLTESLK